MFDNAVRRANQSDFNVFWLADQSAPFQVTLDEFRIVNFSKFRNIVKISHVPYAILSFTYPFWAINLKFLSSINLSEFQYFN